MSNDVCIIYLFLESQLSRQSSYLAFDDFKVFKCCLKRIRTHQVLKKMYEYTPGKIY